MDILVTIVFLIYIVAGWRSLTYMQHMMGLSFFGSMEGLIQFYIMKFLLAGIFGWLAIIITLLHKAFTGKRG